MQAGRLIITFAVTLLIGCSDDAAENRRLRDEVAKLEQQLVTRAAEHSSEIAYHERQAAIAAGCDWVVPLCPDTVTRPGRQAQDAGYSGGSNRLFWGIVLLKLILAATGPAALAITGLLGWEWLLRPSRAQTSEARKLVDQARVETQHLRNAAERDLVETNQAIHDAKHELTELLAEIKDLRYELAQQEALLDRKQQNMVAVEEARRALDSI